MYNCKEIMPRLVTCSIFIEIPIMQKGNVDLGKAEGGYLSISIHWNGLYSAGIDY